MPPPVAIRANGLSRKPAPCLFVMVGGASRAVERHHDKILFQRRNPRFRRMTKEGFCHAEKVGRNTVNLGDPDLLRLDVEGPADTSYLDVLTRLRCKGAPPRFVISFRPPAAAGCISFSAVIDGVARTCARSSSRHNRPPEGGSAGNADDVEMERTGQNRVDQQHENWPASRAAP